MPFDRGDDRRPVTVNDYASRHVALALRSIDVPAATLDLLRAMAAAPDRCMTRQKVLRAYRGRHITEGEEVLALLGARLLAFLNNGLPSAQPRNHFNAVVARVRLVDIGRRTHDKAVGYILRKKLAMALAENGIAPYVELSPDVAWRLLDEADSLDDYPPDLL